MNDQPNWRALITPQFVVSLWMMGLATYATHLVLVGNSSPELKAAVVTAIVITNMAMVLKFWMNSTNESEKKNETINSLAKGTGNGNGQQP